MAYGNLSGAMLHTGGQNNFNDNVKFFIILRGLAPNSYLYLPFTRFSYLHYLTISQLR
jgi:hypothetical protein